MEFFQENIHLSEVFVQLIAFLIVFFTLKKFAWKPLLDSLGKREQGILDSVQKAEHLRQEAEKMIEENKKLLAKADEESRKIIN